MERVEERLVEVESDLVDARREAVEVLEVVRFAANFAFVALGEDVERDVLRERREDVVEARGDRPRRRDPRASAYVAAADVERDRDFGVVVVPCQRRPVWNPNRFKIPSS